MKKSFWIGICFSIIFLYLTFRKINFQEVKQAFILADFLWLFPAAISYLFVYVLRSIRWKYIFSPLKKTHFSSLFSSLIIGFMANNLLPVRMGEFIRAYLIGKKEHISKSTSFATLVVERIFDGITILFLLTVISLFFPFPAWVKKTGIIFFAFLSILIIFLYSLLRWEQPTTKIFQKIIFFLPPSLKEKITVLLSSFVCGLKVLHHKKELFLVCFFSFMIWFAEATTFYLVACAFHLSISFFGAIFIMGLICLGLIIPSSPGFIGVYEYFSITALQLLSVPKSQAIPYTVVIHGLQFSLIMCLGFFFLWKENLSWQQLQSNQKS